MLFVENRPLCWREQGAEPNGEGWPVTKQQTVKVVLEDLKLAERQPASVAPPGKARAKRAAKATAVKLVRGMGKSEASLSSKPAPPSPVSESFQAMSPMRKPVKK